MADDECEPDPCNSDYDYNYDTVDEDDNPIIISMDEGASNYRELLLFEQIYQKPYLDILRQYHIHYL